MEEFQLRQQIPTDIVSNEVPTPQMSDEIWKLILDRSRMPDTMVHMLKGEVWIVRPSKISGEMEGRWASLGEPLMNDEGIRFFTVLFYSSVTPDKLTTFITDQEVNRMMRHMMEAVIDVIVERGDEFQVPASNRSYVALLIEHSYFMALTASRKGTMLKALKPAYERREVYTPQKEPSQGFKLPFFG